MTAPTYDTLTTDDTGADKILTTGTMTALDQNPVSIAQRGTDAPVVQVPVREYKTSGTGATWPIPDGVTAFNIILQGGGGGTNGDGGSTTFTYNSVTYTAAGGTKGTANGPYGVGGTTTNGDTESVSGQDGAAAGVVIGGSSMMGHGGVLSANGSSSGSGYGQGSAFAAVGPVVYAGGAGGTLRKRIAVVSGQTTGTFTVGAAGSAGAGAAGGAGLIIIEY